MTTKTIKTVLFASLIAAVILPFSTLIADAASNENLNSDTKGNVPDRIPKDVLLERDFEKWNTKYVNEDQFHVKQESIKSYTRADFPQNGWNQYMQKAATIIHNFETINGNIGTGYELTGLFAAKDRLSGVYDASEPVSKLHDWTIDKYNIPTSIDQIDERIETIVPEKHLHLVAEYVSTFNGMADHGSVPDELHDQDADYWIMIRNVSLCGYVEDCDLPLMKNILDTDLYRTSDTLIPTFDLMDVLLPKASAVTYVFNYGYLFVDPYDCEYSSTCEVSTSGSGTNPYTLNIFTSQSDEHSFGNYIEIYASTCSSVSGKTAKVSGDLEAKQSTYPIWAQSLNCAIDDREINLGGNPDSPWFWDATTTHEAWS